MADLLTNQHQLKPIIVSSPKNSNATTEECKQTKSDVEGIRQKPNSNATTEECKQTKSDVEGIRQNQPNSNAATEESKQKKLDEATRQNQPNSNATNEENKQKKLDEATRQNPKPNANAATECKQTDERRRSSVTNNKRRGSSMTNTNNNINKKRNSVMIKTNNNTNKQQDNNNNNNNDDEYCCGGVMSKETWSGVKVTVLWTVYVLLGSVVFMKMETKEVTTSTSRDHRVWARFKEVAGGIDNMPEVVRLREILLDLCSHPVLNHTFGQLTSLTHNNNNNNNNNNTVLQRVGLNQTKMDGSKWWQEVESECQESLRISQHITKTTTWSLVDSIYYTMTAVTTIGYGHIYPTSIGGRRFCVLFCMIGVPLTCILLAKSSDMLSNRILALYERTKKRYRGHPKVLLYGITWVYLTLGFIVFMFLPSIAISKLEGWSYEKSLYMTFITLSTIGFGDFYPGYDEDREHGDLYKMVIVVWIMVALGYWFMLLNFLQKALRKNVPQRIKRFRKTHNIIKQKVFFRQLVNKVISQRGESETEEPTTAEGTEEALRKKLKKSIEERQVGALVEEVVGVLDSRRASRASRHQSLSAQGEMMTMAESGVETGDGPAITLSQLLDVKVCVRSQGVPTLRSVVAQSPKEHELTRTFRDLFDHSRKKNQQQQQQNEVEEDITLPLRDVLNLISLMKAVDDEVNASGIYSTSSVHGESSSSLSSPLSTLTSLDNNKEYYMPLLGTNSSGVGVGEKITNNNKLKGKNVGVVVVNVDVDDDDTDYDGDELDDE